MGKRLPARGSGAPGSLGPPAPVPRARGAGLCPSFLALLGASLQPFLYLPCSSPRVSSVSASPVSLGLAPPAPALGSPQRLSPGLGLAPGRFGGRGSGDSA